MKYHRSTTSSCKGIGIKKLNICKKYDFKNYFLIVKKIEEENLVKLRNEKENSVNLRNEKKNSVNLRNEKENSVSLETDRESGNGNPHKPLIRKTKKWEKEEKKIKKKNKRIKQKRSKTEIKKKIKYPKRIKE